MPEISTFDLTGSVALVTGASSGFGVHFATVLANAGAHVVIGARRIAQLEIAAQGIRACGGSVSTVSLDVALPSSIEAALKGIGAIDILVNNAGIVRDGGAMDQSEADWDSVIDTNLKGMFLMTQAVARTMIARGRGGSIINIASILGLRQAGGVLPYAVSKAGVIQFTKTMALEMARHGIRINALAPGYFDTELNADFWNSDPGRKLIKRIPQRRLGQLDDLSGPLLLLASDLSRYMTGSVLAVDGGHLVSSL